MNKKKQFCGYITIMGKTNVGKSTFINQIIGKKISIISRKKNTTQCNITGIKTEDTNQFIYVDTPGIHFNQKNHSTSKKYNNFYKATEQAVLIVFIVDRNIWNNSDEIIAQKIQNMCLPVIIGINKIDQLSNKSILLPHIQFLQKKMNAIEIIPMSAKKNENVFLFNKIIQFYLPEKSHLFSKDNTTTNSIFFTVSEIIREKFIYFLGDELPSIIKVKTESIKKRHAELYITSIIYVKNIRHKKIVIGHNATLIKKCNMIARSDIAKLFRKNIHLFLWVKEG